MQNSAFWARITSLYGSQTSPIVLCMQNSVICSRMTNQYGFQISSVVLSTHNSVLSTRKKKTILVPALTCGFVHAKKATLGLELQVSLGPRLHLWFLHANNVFWTRMTSLYGSKTWPVVLCMYNIVPSIRITTLYWSQPSSVVFACKTATFGPELQVSMVTRPHL